jgi:hypothetical protein
MMFPSAAQAMRIKVFTAVLFISRVSQATRFSKSLMKRESCSAAQGTVSVTTPCSGHSSRQSIAWMVTRHLPSETWRHTRWLQS